MGGGVLKFSGRQEPVCMGGGKGRRTGDKATATPTQKMDNNRFYFQDLRFSEFRVDSTNHYLYYSDPKPHHRTIF